MRGNQRTSGELSRKEGGKIFGSGSRTPISITILVRKPNHAGSAAIHYEAVADYLSREEKLALVSERGSMLSGKMNLSSIAPNEAGDWINQRDSLFETFIQIGSKEDKTAKTFFVPYYSCGIQTNRDTWAYNFSADLEKRNARFMVETYNEQVAAFAKACALDRGLKVEDFVLKDETKIKWSSSLLPQVSKGHKASYSDAFIVKSMYRPFCKQYLYNDSLFIHRPYQIPRLFPTPQSKNLVICTAGVGSKTFSALITDQIPDLHILESGTQCFPLYWYEKNERDTLSLFDNSNSDYTRRSGLTDFILQRAREEYGPKTSAEDVFYYVYGLLHSIDYRKKFAADLSKELPRIPLVGSPQEFKAFMKAGRKLADLHLHYETGPLCRQLIITGAKPDKLNVTKMRFPSKEDKGTILFNDSVKIENIPITAYDYVVNGKSAVEWVMERYAVTKNADSGIINDPNLWSDNPRYILDLVSRVIQMSVETHKIVAGLPKLDFSSQKS